MSAWLLLAIELNGALISKGAQAALDAHQCAVEIRVMAPVIAAPVRDTVAWTTEAFRCSLDEAEGMLRIQLPQEMLAEKRLALAEPSGAMGIALLHDPAVLSGHADYSAQPLPQVIPSLAFDIAAGSDLNGLGVVAARGPWSASLLHQKPSQGSSLARASSELFLEDGGQLRVGDVRAERGPEQAFGEYRGLHFRSRAQALKSDGKAEAMLAVQSPSRVQFLDRNGIAIYSSEVLPPGNYRVQGYAASATPGFLEAQIIDVNGSVQTVSLPWTSDRRLLLQDDTEWDVLAGTPRALGAGLKPPAVIAARARHGLSSQLTVGASVERAGDQHRASLEATSSAIGGMLATAAVGQSCNDQGCHASWLGELRTSVSPRWHASLSAQSLAVSSRSALFTLTGQLHAALSGSLQLAYTEEPNPTSMGMSSRQVATLAASMRIAPAASLQLQLRHQLLQTDQASWSGYLGLTMHFAKERTTVSGQLAFPSQSSGASPRLGMQAAYGAGGLYGSSFSVAHAHDAKPRSDLYARHASPYGDLSMRADSISDRASWSASTRLWLTAHGARLAPAGEDNLVIQNLGIPTIRLHHAARDTQVSDAKGIAVFRRAPSWTDAIYAIDTASIPFGAQLSASRIRVPLAANRAYLIDMRHLWSQSRSWRIAGFDVIRAGALDVRNQRNKKVFVSDDGYADLQSIDELPISMLNTKGERLRCDIRTEPGMPPQAALSLSQDMVLHCAPHIAL